MNVPRALQLGALIEDAYDGYHDGLPNFDGKVYDGYQVIQTVYANDLATELSPTFDPLVDIVPIGFVARNSTDPNDVVIVIRGTEGIWEWVQDAKILPIPCPIVPGSGLTEDGFTDMYQSMRVKPDLSSPRLIDVLGSGLLGADIRTVNLTICGHSLGSALVTLMALDVAAQRTLKGLKHLALYTFASPRVGDLHFADYFNVTVPDCYRIANRMDIVTHVPTPPLYIHVGDETELNPGKEVANTLLCMHEMATYLYMLSGGKTTLDSACAKPVIASTNPQPGGIVGEVVQDIERII